MSWLKEDWEYPNDYIYAIERHYDMQAEWQQYEEEQASKNRLPAVIKIKTPILVNETNSNSRTIPRTYQKRL
jgi:hypothetical protein